MNLERDSLIQGRYRILDILGEGGMGAVYRALDENLGVEVALKENFFTSDEYARQFQREASILASLRHPHLPRVTDHFVIENQGQYLVMDFMEGEDLRERIERQGTLSESEVVVLGVAICDALTYMHSREPMVIHRDIKPGNVKINPAGEVALVDFGLAKIIEGDRETTPGARAMTPGYSPPEQYGTARTDPRTDIYSLGATLYEALTGAVPEDGLSRMMEQSHLSPVRKRNPDISRNVARVIEKALAVRPEDRYQSAEDFKQAMISISRGLTRKRVVEGGLRVEPPPSMDGKALPVEGDDLELPDVVATDYPFPVSADLSKPLQQPSRRQPIRMAGLLVILVLGILLGGSAGLYFFFPDLSAQALSIFGRSLISQTIAPEERNFTPLESISTPSLGTAAAVLRTTPTTTPSPLPSPTPTATMAPTATPIEAVIPPPTATDTPLPPPTATPQGGGYGQIAFASDRTGVPQIWIANSDGTDLHRITDMPNGACQPHWSPDGSRFVFISPCDRDREIYQNSSLFIIDADGENLTPLPTILGGDYDPAWSPDGNRIAFTSLRVDNRPQIYFLDLETEEVTPLSTDIARDFQPAWSADGDQLLFVTTRRGPNQIWVTEVGGGFQELFSRSGGYKNSHPAWSPDRKVVIFNQSKSEDDVTTLMGVRFENQNYFEFRLFYNRAPSRDAKFSADGVWIAFESWPDGKNHDIYIMTPNGVGLQRLTTHPAWDFDPAWRTMPVVSEDTGG